ncbi:MAG: PIG-L family deacetylase [Bacteroidia bacterium]|nr:PIG-L family deacetylase [Bacteroidia bacterium]
MKKSSLWLLLCLCVYQIQAQPVAYNTSDILLSLEKLNTLGSVLYIAAHPDDENTRLLGYYANEKHLQTTYLAITRGDGGQNLIGNEQGDLLGVIRTEELLAARRIDRAGQFFTRAIDFGYTKSPEETFSIWNKDSILSDVVWAVRKFRPDIIILRFPTTGEGGHGHHTASAILGLEAFDRAADKSAFPEQFQWVEPWQATRIFWNVFRPKPEDISNPQEVCAVDVGSYNPLLGKSYGELASESRSMHKSQGFGTARSRGSQNDYLKFLKGQAFSGNELSGINTSWTRVRNGEIVGKLIEGIIHEFKPEDPAASVKGLLEVRSAIEENITDEYWKSRKLLETDQLIAACSGLFAEAVAGQYSVVPGDSISVSVSSIIRSDFPLTVKSIMIPGKETLTTDTVLPFNRLVSFDVKVKVPPDARYTNPYWLDLPASKGTFTVKSRLLEGTPESPPAISAKITLLAGNQSITIERPVLYKWVDPVKGEQYRQLEILPPVSVNPVEDVSIFVRSRERKISAVVHANKDDQKGEVFLRAPQGWTVKPASIPFGFTKKDEEKQFTFSVVPSRGYNDGRFLFSSIISGREYGKKTVMIEHDHIPIQTLVRNADTRCVSINLQTVPLKIGYITGAGDKIPECLEQAGYKVTTLGDDTLTGGNLSVYDVIITGIRAYNTNDRIAVYQQRLMDFVKAGGTLLTQYNTSNFLSSVKTRLGPYPFDITRDRVTDENAEVRFIHPSDPLLKSPNAITGKDFDGWIQERGLYFAGNADSAYTSVFSMNDTGDKPLDGSLIYARYGKGIFIYTGLSFFRELPAGVPGAYRLFVNLMAAGYPVHDKE